LGGVPSEPPLATGQSFADEMPFVPLFKPPEFDECEAIVFRVAAIPAPAIAPNEHSAPKREFRSANAESMQSTLSETGTLARGEPALKVEAKPD
jgi:hypothetical protein